MHVGELNVFLTLNSVKISLQNCGPGLRDITYSATSFRPLRSSDHLGLLVPMSGLSWLSPDHLLAEVPRFGTDFLLLFAPPLSRAGSASF